MYVRGLEIDSYFVKVAGSAYVNGDWMYASGATGAAWYVEAGDSNEAILATNPDGAAAATPRSKITVIFYRKDTVVDPLVCYFILYYDGTYEFQHDVLPACIYGAYFWFDSSDIECLQFIPFSDHRKYEKYLAKKIMQVESLF